ncbi:uncharacterized protein DDB_G0283697 [Hyalella azteca]|uniref:Uncharacterized protein DDB_G0283697 n=1 Tax=Hyalella azteca TaxID=294128 RepID=A0A8B7MZ70_HYAAZ|nr:uncharacterized protein DDB_G0283697 [Hyalella azteca]
MADEVVDIGSSEDEIDNIFGSNRSKSEEDIQVVACTSKTSFGTSHQLPWSSSYNDSSSPGSSKSSMNNGSNLKVNRILPPSSSRQEIKSIIRNSTQSSIGQFLVQETVDERRKRILEAPCQDEPRHKKLKTSQSEGSKKPDDISVLPVSGDSDLGPECNTSKKKNHIEDLPSPVNNSDVSNAPQKSDDESHQIKDSVSKFIEKWESVKGAKDKSDKKIEEKIWRYFYLAHTSFTHSKLFRRNIETAMNRINSDNVYVLIKDLLDCLKSYKDVPYQEPSRDNNVTTEASCEPPRPLTEEEAKTEKKLRKIEKTMAKIAEQIKVLDEAEVDLDDEDNSAYLVQERLKAQFMKLDDYYCRLAGCSRSTGRPLEKRFRYQGSRYPEINQRISAWINKHREFPDYLDVLNLVKKVTNESALPLRPETVRVQAQEIFRDVGKMLKERRENDDLYSIYSYCDSDAPDPATQNPELAAILDENAVVASNKLSKVFQEFVDKETEMREVSDLKADSKKTSTDDETTGHESRLDGDEAINEEAPTSLQKFSDTNKQDNEGRRDSGSQRKGVSSSDQPENDAFDTVNDDDSESPFSPIVQQELVFDDGGQNDDDDESDDNEENHMNVEEDDDDDDDDEEDDVDSLSLPDIEHQSDDDSSSNEAPSMKEHRVENALQQRQNKSIEIPVVVSEMLNDRVEKMGDAASLKSMNAASTLDLVDSRSDDKLEPSFRKSRAENSLLLESPDIIPDTELDNVTEGMFISANAGRKTCESNALEATTCGRRSDTPIEHTSPSQKSNSARNKLISPKSMQRLKQKNESLTDVTDENYISEQEDSGSLHPTKGQNDAGMTVVNNYRSSSDVVEEVSSNQEVEVIESTVHGPNRTQDASINKESTSPNKLRLTKKPGPLSKNSSSSSSVPKGPVPRIKTAKLSRLGVTKGQASPASSSSSIDCIDTNIEESVVDASINSANGIMYNSNGVHCSKSFEISTENCLNTDTPSSLGKTKDSNRSDEFKDKSNLSSMNSSSTSRSLSCALSKTKDVGEPAAIEVLDSAVKNGNHNENFDVDCQSLSPQPEELSSEEDVLLATSQHFGDTDDDYNDVHGLPDARFDSASHKSLEVLVKEEAADGRRRRADPVLLVPNGRYQQRAASPELVELD